MKSDTMNFNFKDDIPKPPKTGNAFGSDPFGEVDLDDPFAEDEFGKLG